ncbi:unnamed protein product [Plutella xylostella]|uniref:(diamondback moth) hypothetical protein n=1 Tax=Plutella xylostella TaxID=51655 RepID=A0A8S4FT49_PLUXY|nr:unnamed protein product [Plutella xylostella]
MENLKYRVIYEYEFHRGTSAAETARRINDVYGDGVAKENTVRFWFQRFRSGNFDLQNKPHGRPETKVDNEAIVEADPSQTTSELAAGSGVSDKTILIHLKQIGKVKKLERWVPHELSEANRQTRVDCCVTLLNRHNNEGILNRIITCDEKWILYDNRKRSSQWLNPGEPAKSCPKRKLTKKKLLRAFCAFCQDRIWGLGRQGFKCIQCKLLVHKKCHKLVQKPCSSEHVDPIEVKDETNGEGTLPRASSVRSRADPEPPLPDTPPAPPAAPAVRSEDLEPGSQRQYSLDDFELIRVIGRGSYAKGCIDLTQGKSLDVSDSITTRLHAQINIDAAFVCQRCDTAIMTSHTSSCELSGKKEKQPQ